MDFNKRTESTSYRTKFLSPVPTNKIELFVHTVHVVLRVIRLTHTRGLLCPTFPTVYTALQDLASICESLELTLHAHKAP